MILIPLKPVSTNEMYKLNSNKWRRPEYLDFRDEVKEELEIKGLRLPSTGSLKFDMKFGIAENFDLDNCLKPFIDAVEYTFEGLNDNRVSKILAEKIIVGKGDEFIEFNGVFLPVKAYSSNVMYGSTASNYWRNEKYLKFKRDVLKFIKHEDIFLHKDQSIKYNVVYGISSRFDLDNAIKVFVDILKDRYNFDDDRITKIDAEKQKVKRGLEFIEFDLVSI